MKVLFLSTLLVAGVVCEAPAPYPASGWRPAGPAFELPQKIPQKQYGPPVDPRNPFTPGQEYGPPEVDVSVQGLPTQEQLPIFQVSPINGPQYVGAAFNSDIRNLDQSLQQSQIQQETYRHFARQRQLEAEAQAQTQTQVRQNQPIPRQFVQKTTPRPTQSTTTTESSTTTTSTESYSLNQGEILEDSPEPSQKVSVEVSKQRIQEFPPELLLSPLGQLNLQSQYAPLQLGQIRAPVFFQPAQGLSQRQIAGYDAETHLAALPSVLAQQQLAKQLAESQILLQNQPQVLQVQPQSQGVQSAYLVPNQQNAFVQEQQILNQYQLQGQYPIQAQPIALQPQVSQIQQNYEQAENQYPSQPQFVIQQSYQPIKPQDARQPQVSQIQPNYEQAENQNYPNQPQFVIQQSYQPIQSQDERQFQLTQAQLYQQQVFQNQLIQGQRQGQSQEGLQSGFDVNQQGNGLENEERETEDDEGVTTATAVATAFGARTQPRVSNTYGAPAPVPRQQADPRYQTTTEAQDEEQTTPTPRRKSAKLRNGRVRPVFTLDKSGHLVLSPEM